ncbi:T9SS type A sorting domain-containing protein [bacterium]|nr:T9SS type A sorting domain-containing protein [bacterium]MBU1982908.1 T9SS type A sorting domain-containing protein [bacterium]
MKRTFALTILLAVAALALAQTQPPQTMINVNEQLAPWRAYYDSQAEWPRAHGWKPFKRYEWDMLQRSWPDGLVPAGAYWQALEQRGRMPRMTLDEPWTNLGPYNHGGRTRVIRFHPNNPMVMFAGAVSGGLWKSTDGGESWLPFSDQLSNLAVGCFEMDPTNPDVMYLGTGEGYFNGDAVLGIGLLKSTNAGQSWNPTALSWNYGAGRSVLKLNIDPRNGQIVLASTNDSLYRSINGGQSFARVLSGNINELKRDPQNPDILLCGAGYPWGNIQNGVYRSTDNGINWTRTSTGLPNANSIGRIVLAFYPANSQVVYAGVCGSFSYNSSQMIAIFRSLDNGLTWTQMTTTGTNHYASQGWYDMAIAVKPDESNMIFSSGLDLYRSTNSGTTWRQLSRWHYDFGHPDYIHADHHEIVFHPTNTNELWEVTDGGIFKSVDLGENWVEKSNGYVTFQYYAMGNATLDTALAYGGTQDNGTFRWAGSPDHDPIYGGDGGYCVVDYTNNNTIYVEWQNGHRYRSDNAGQNFSDINPGIDGDGPWVTPMVLDPFDHLTIYTTTANGSVWKSPNQGRNGNWQTIGQSLGGNMQVLEVSETVPGRLYLGTSSAVYRYDSGTNLWTNVTGNLPGAWVTRVVPDPFDPNIVYVTLSGFGTGHVWKSTNAGGAWQNISGNLPDVPFQDVVVDRSEPSTLYAGGDIGVYVTTNGGQTWAILGEGLPAARVDDMDLQRVTGVLRIATHGRGMWEVPTGGANLALFYPNGGETLPLGENIIFRWSGVSFGGTVTIEINRSYPSASWSPLFTSTANDGQQAWTVTGPEAEHVRFRIAHNTITGETDTSNTDSRISSPALTLLWPNGGETILTGRRDTVRFGRLLVSEILRLELNRDYPNGAWELLSDNVWEDSAVQWTVQLPASENARLRLTSSERPELADESDAGFTIRAPQMTIESPNGGEQLPVGTPTLIRWSAAEHVGTLRIQLNRSYPGGAWETISANTVNDGEYTWAPTAPASAQCRIRLQTPFDFQTYVESAGDFSITILAADDAPELPTRFALSEPHPNPFNPATQITLSLPARTEVIARVYNRLGQVVALLADGELEPGEHTLTFDGSDLPSGLYFLRITAYDQTRMMKAVLIK